MGTPLPYAQAVDIGHGRGRLSARAARSLRRVDSAFGRAADINEAWRSPEQADENRRKYLAYLNGTGPWAPIAYGANDSVHCVGEAVDTDDTADWQIRIWNDHGWYWTVYRVINGKRTLVERWHLEYFEDRDNHRNDPAPASVSARAFTPAQEEENPDMPVFIEKLNIIQWPNGFINTYDPNVFRVLQWVAKGQSTEDWAVSIYVSETWNANTFMAQWNEDMTKPKPVTLTAEASAELVSKMAAAAIPIVA